jgi:translation initiation factor 1A
MKDEEFFDRKKGTEVENPELMRVRTPRAKETLGVVEQRLGASRMSIKCFDGKARVCRIPGRLKRKLWVREGDIVLVEPWELGGNEKGDILYKYKKNQVQWLQTHGYIKSLDDSEEF